MLILQLGSLAQCEKELRRIVISASVRHRNQTAPDESQTGMKLIFERCSVHRIAATSIAIRIAALHDETFDQAMEDGVIVVTLHTELNKIATCLRCFPTPQFDVNVTDGSFQQHLQMTEADLL